MTDRMYASLEANFPWIVRDMIETKMRGDFEVIVKTVNGEVYSFNYLDCVLHRLPDDSNNMTEHECRSEFGRNLYRMILQRKMTQTELSRLTGIPQCQLSNYVRGKTCPSFYNVDKIAKALNCSMDELRYMGL